jgi:hypothetical protein
MVVIEYLHHDDALRDCRQVVYGVVDGQRVQRAARSRPVVVVVATVGLAQFDSWVHRVTSGYTFDWGLEDEDILAVYYLSVEEVWIGVFAELGLLD